MTKYKKKPIEVDVYHYCVDPLFPDWYIEKVFDGTIDLKGKPIDFETFKFENFNAMEFLKNSYAEIKTLEGIMRVNYGDYIIKGVEGEVYPCRKDIFEQTYEEVIEE